MADPLSIIASIIAVVGAAEGVTKTLAQLKSIRNAPDELLALINEVSDLKVILSDVQMYVVHNTQRLRIFQAELQNLSTLIDRAKTKLLDLDRLIQYRLMKPESTSNQIKTSRREWLRARSTVNQFRQALRDIRLNIVTQMVVINSSHQSRIGLTIDEIHIIAGQLQTSQSRSSDRTSQQLDEHSRLLANILSSQSSLQDLLQLHNSADEQTHSSTSMSLADHPEYPSSSTVRIRAYQYQRSPCTRNCGCACHNVQAFRSPALLHEVVGTLFVGYSGYPIKALQRCTEASCVSRSTFRAYVHYLFPSWFLLKAFTVAVISIFLSEISVSLTVRRIVPAGAEIFRLVRQDDINGIKRLFDMGLASPNDCFNEGQPTIMIAVTARKLKACKFLLEAGADPYLERFDSRQSTFHIAWNAIFTRLDEPETSKLLQELFPDKDGALEERGFTQFHKTVLGLGSTTLEQEISNDVSRIDCTDSAGNTPLIWAARRGDNAAVDLLIEAGADVNKVDDAGIPALMHAVRSIHLSRLKCVKALLRAGANPRVRDYLGYNVLHGVAATYNGRDIPKVLIEAGTDMDGRNNLGATPLASAAYGRNAISAKALVDFGANINAVDNEGDSPLHESLLHHADDVLQLLLSRGASYTAICSTGDSVLHLAAVTGDLKTLDILLEAKLTNIDTGFLSKEGKTALQLAQGQLGKPEGFLEKFEELLTDIRIRNTELPNVEPNESSTRPGIWYRRLALVEWTNLVRVQLIHCVRLASVFASTSIWITSLIHIVVNSHRGSLTLLWDSIGTHWITGLCFATFFYIYSTFGVKWVTEIIGALWEIAGPGGFEKGAL